MEPFKSSFSPELVRLIADHAARHDPGFDAQGFAARCVAALPPLELKARAQMIADELHAALTPDPDERARVLTAMLHPDELDHANQPTDSHGICGWGILPLSLLVADHGLPDFARSLELLRRMTMRFSSEFAVRPFLLMDQPRALAIMSGWVTDPNRHVRRLVSEGTRPRLPWAMRLPALVADPDPVLPLLRALRDDPEPYVRRSVANHLNDIAKDHPDRLAQLARQWWSDSSDRQALLRHGCRTLIKAGHPEVLALFGHERPEVTVDALGVRPSAVGWGGAVDVSARLTSTAARRQALVVDVVLHFHKANGRLSPKVFKGGRLMLDPGETRSFRFSHSFRPITTRRYYPGTHAVGLRVNGQDSPVVPFTLLAEAATDDPVGGEKA